MTTKELTAILRTEARTQASGKVVLPCAKAFKISRDHGVSLKKIGAACNANNIRISQCQLGCFA